MFVAGLIDEVRCDVVVAQPTTYHQALSLAKLYEQRSNSVKQSAQLVMSKAHSGPGYKSTGGVNNPGATALSKKPTYSGEEKREPAKFNTPKRLTAVEMRQRREKGLCYYCDEKYNPGHKCKTNQLFVLEQDDIAMLIEEMSKEAGEKVGEEITPEVECHFISMNALTGVYNPNIIKLTGTCRGTAVRVLIDGGSTLNFMHPKVVDRLKIKTKDMERTCRVIAASGPIDCNKVCERVELQMQGHTLEVDFFVLDMLGSEIVLGVQWLRNFRPVITDYVDSTVKIEHKGTEVVLQGDKPEEVSLKSMKKV